MAHTDGDFLAGEDLDDLYFLLGGYLDDDTDFNLELDTLLSEVAADEVGSTFKCDKCDKICKSKRRLTRHINMKYSTPKKDSELATALKELSLENLIEIVKKCAAIAAADVFT